MPDGYSPFIGQFPAWVVHQLNCAGGGTITGVVVGGKFIHCGGAVPYVGGGWKFWVGGTVSSFG